jgi:putative ABC transport system permease protein
MSRLDDLFRRFPALLMARRNLSRNRIRSTLATLGIVIGVLAIAALGMFGTTLRAGANEQLGDIGNELTVSPNFEEGVQNLTDRDVDDVERVVEGAAVVPIKRDQRRVTRGRESVVVTAYGMETPAALYDAADGRVPVRFRQGVVVGANTADRLDLEVGNSVTVDGTAYRVRAILDEETGISLVNPNDAVVLPPGEFEEDTYQQIVVSTDTGQEANRTAMAIKETLNRREERVTVFELSSVTQNINDFFALLNAFLVGIGSISLVVAGVSILNVMLMSTIERRQEIGVLRAVGVQRTDVIRMILAEAGLLGGLGSLFGGIAAVGAGLLLNWYVLQDPMATFTVTNGLYLALAVAFGVGTSLLSGLYPAWKVANERPVDALRE